MSRLPKDILSEITSFTYGAIQYVQVVYETSTGFAMVFMPKTAFNILRNWQVNDHHVSDPSSLEAHQRIKNMEVDKIDAMTAGLLQRKEFILTTLPGFDATREWFFRKVNNADFYDLLFDNEITHAFDPTDKNIFLCSRDQIKRHKKKRHIFKVVNAKPRLDILDGWIKCVNFTPKLFNLFHQIHTSDCPTKVTNLNLAEFVTEPENLRVFHGKRFSAFIHVYDIELELSMFVQVFANRYPWLSEYLQDVVFVSKNQIHVANATTFKGKTFFISPRYVKDGKATLVEYNVWVNKRTDPEKFAFYQRRACDVEVPRQEDQDIYLHEGVDFTCGKTT
jgi:hypothetical protein